MSVFSPTCSAIYAIGATISETWLRSANRIGQMRIFCALTEVGEMISLVAIAVAAAGLKSAALTTIGPVNAKAKVLRTGFDA